MTSASQSIMNRILALFAKAESSEFEEEAATYLAKAEELMIKHDVERADLTPEEREKVERVQVTIGANRPDHLLWNITCLSRGVHFVRGYPSGAGTIGSLIGLPADLAFVQALFASLVIQRETHLAKAERPYWENGRTFNHSFRVGFGNRVYQRLNAAKAKTVQEAGASTALVLRNKEAEVAERVKALFPKLKKGPSISAHSTHGYAAGTAAANRADVSGGHNNVGGSRRAIR